METNETKPKTTESLLFVLLLSSFWHASGWWFFILSFWFECLIKPFCSRDLYDVEREIRAASQKKTLSKIIIHSVLKTNRNNKKTSKIIYLFLFLEWMRTELTEKIYVRRKKVKAREIRKLLNRTLHCKCGQKPQFA